MMEISLEDWMAQIRAGGKVKRCHTVPVHKEESVAHHSWGVAVMLIKFNPNASKALLCAALFHDVTEVYTGDVPAQAKWQSPGLKQELTNLETQYNRLLNIEYLLTENENIWLKTCDHIDLILYCLDEIYMGNNNTKEIVERLIARLDDIGVPSQIRSYYNFIKKRFYDHYTQQKEKKHAS